MRTIAGYETFGSQSPGGSGKLARHGEPYPVNYTMVIQLENDLQVMLEAELLSYKASIYALEAYHYHRVVPNSSWHAMWHGLGDRLVPPPLVQALDDSNAGNLSKTLDDVASSFTNALRSGPNSTTIRGTVMLPMPYVHVQWPWLLYPAMLSLVATLFFIVSLYFSFNREGVVWKSYTLPLLFHGLQGWQAGELNPKEDIEDDVGASIRRPDREAGFS